MDKGLEMQRSKWCSENEKWSVMARVWGRRKAGVEAGWAGPSVKG